jgi:hypothetical protein
MRASPTAENFWAKAANSAGEQAAEAAGLKPSTGLEAWSGSTPPP